MIYVLDTNALGDILRENVKIQLRLAQMAPEDDAVICPIVRGELLFGIVRLPPGRRRDELRLKSERLFTKFRCENVGEAASDYYASIKLARQRQGRPINENDLWIAATTLSLSARLVSRDTDFAGIDGLLVEDWSA